MEIENKVALVTGAARGIGFACVRELLHNGAKVVAILDLESSQGLTSAEKLCEEFGKNRAVFIACDVTKNEQLEESFKKLTSEFGALDIVMNNAGILRDIEWELTIDVNFKAVVRGTLLAFEYMGKHHGGKGGVVVNTASAAGVMICGFYPIYEGTKHAVVGFTRSLGQPDVYEKTGIRTLVLCPCGTETDMLTSHCSTTLDFIDSEKVKKIVLNSGMQSPADLALGVMEMIRKAESGTVWLSELDHPIRQVNFPPMATMLQGK